MTLAGAVLGLGMMGRHHARLLQSMEGVRLAGAVDPLGDRHGVVGADVPVVASLDELLSRTPVDFAIVAVPTEEHLPAVRRLAEAGVHLLIEKPLAASTAEADEIIAICERTGVRGAVGHVERFNPALLELRRRALDGQLGEIFLIATERVGPFPDRVRDVGVVKDLATHDLDLVRWLGSSPMELIAAQTSHRMGRPHEDIVLATGRLQSGVAFNCVVDWLTPTKKRSTRILGERGMLVADTLTADLTYYENGDVRSEWDSTRQLRGVSEGDAVRYALSRREPLLVELETFVAHLHGDAADGIVSLQTGREVVLYAEAVLRSAQSGDSVRLPTGRGDAA
jgi:UDP-N-acetylglucosamine 3-dehydrogenase